MRFWILVVACLVGCAHHNNSQTISFTVVEPDRPVYTSGGGGGIAFPTSVDAIKKELESLQTYAERCTEDCGVMFEVGYNDSVSQDELTSAINMLVAVETAVLHLPCYVRVMPDNRPRRNADIYARFTVGEVRLE